MKVAEMPLAPHSEARAELTERAESTLREQLERERERADRLETELQQERSKGCWVRSFGSYRWFVVVGYGDENDSKRDFSIPENALKSNHRSVSSGT